VGILIVPPEETLVELIESELTMNITSLELFPAAGSTVAVQVTTVVL